MARPLLKKGCRPYSCHPYIFLESTMTETTTIKTYLRPIDRDGLLAFAEKGRNNPASRGTNKVHTVVDGKYRTLSYVGDHTPVVVDEPLHLFGQDRSEER